MFEVDRGVHVAIVHSTAPARLMGTEASFDGPVAVRKTEAELTELARAIARHELYIATRPEDMVSFNAILAMADIPPERFEGVGAVYEYMDKAGSLSINGRPMFLSAQFLHVDDGPLLSEKLRGMYIALGLDPDTGQPV
mgnify:CR=1 FL=1